MEATWGDIARNCEETLLDLYPTFVGCQVFKPSFHKWDRSFQALVSIDEAEIELDGVEDVIDFTKSIYSAQSQQYIHIASKKQGGATGIRQFTVKAGVDKHKKLEIIASGETIVENPLRIFQVEGHLVIVKADTIDCRSVENLSNETMQQVLFTGSVAGMTITNETESGSLFCARNVQTFGKAIPK